MNYKTLFATACMLSTLALSTQTGHSQQLNSDPQLKKAGAGRIEAVARQATKSDVYISTLGGDVFQLDIETGRMSEVVSTFTPFTDIAMCPNRTLYAISFYDLFVIDVKKKTATRVGAHNVSGLNSLVCSSRNVLLGHSASGTTLVQLDRTTAQGIVVGKTGSFRASGDLEFVGNQLYMSTTNKRLVQINPASGKVLRSSKIGSPYVFGLATLGKQLYGFIQDEVYEVNAKTGKRTLLMDLDDSIGTISGATAAIVK